MGKITILLQLDACRSDYISIENCPFLHKLASEGLQGTLVPTFGFEPDGAYIAGQNPDQIDGGAQFWYKPSTSPFKNIPLFEWMNFLPRISELVFRKLLMRIVRMYCKAPTLSLARVPFHLLRYFSFPMTVGMNHPDFCSTSTVFDLLREVGASYLFHCHPENGVDLDSVVCRAEADLEPPLAFAFFHIGNLDRVGHKYGPDSPEMQVELGKVDKGIDAIYQLAKSRFTEVHFLAIGDHGMMAIEQKVDVLGVLDTLPLKLEKDYLCFLDSTMARFWFFSDQARALIVDALDKMGGGHILMKEEIEHYNLDYNHNRFGEIIYLVDPGVLIYPNFYQRDKPEKGMHGYAPEIPEQQSLFLLHSPKITPSFKGEKHLYDMRQVFPTVLDLLDLPIPKTCKLESIVRRHALYN